MTASSPGFSANISFINPTATTAFFDPVTTGLLVPVSTLTGNQVAEIPYSCTINAIFFSGLTTTAAGSTNTQTVTVFKNPTQTGTAASGGTNTGMTCSITSGTSAGEKVSCSDTTHTVSLVAGDTIYVQYSQTNTGPFIKDAFSMICH